MRIWCGRTVCSNNLDHQKDVVQVKFPSPCADRSSRQGAKQKIISFYEPIVRYKMYICLMRFVRFEWKASSSADSGSSWRLVVVMRGSSNYTFFYGYKHCVSNSRRARTTHMWCIRKGWTRSDYYLNYYCQHTKSTLCAAQEVISRCNDIYSFIIYFGRFLESCRTYLI